MKFKILSFISGFAALASAQVLNGLPDCAKTCVNQFTSGDSIGGCPSLNIVCICSSPNFLSQIACCLSSVCNTTDQQAAVDFAQKFCKSSGVTNLPSAVTCASTASATGNATARITTPSTSSKPTSATGNAGARYTAGVGAGVFGGLAAGVALW